MTDVDKLADELRPIYKAMQEDGVDLFRLLKMLDTQQISVIPMVTRLAQLRL